MTVIIMSMITYGVLRKTERSNDYDETKGMKEQQNPTMLKIMRSMEVEETPEIGEDTTINEESESNPFKRDMEILILILFPQRRRLNYSYK